MRKMMLILFLIPFLFSCDRRNRSYDEKESTLEKKQREYFEASIKNKDAQIEASTAALKTTQDRKVDLEVKHSVENARELTAKDPVKYPPADLAAEIARIYSVGESKKRSFREAAERAEVIRKKDEDTNLKYGRAISDTLIKAKTPPPTTDTTPATTANTGVVPPNPTLIDP